MKIPLQPPVSFQLTPHQLAWLDSRRSNGALSRSAALRQALDTLMRIEAEASPGTRHRASIGFPCAAAVDANPIVMG